MTLVVDIDFINITVLPGDTLQCYITFKNEQNTSDHNEKKIDPHEPLHISCASAQIHGQYVIDPLKITLPPSTAQKISPGSNLPKLENGRFICASRAELLVCNLKLDFQKSKTVLYSCSIPNESLPPSYIGVAAKYTYHLTVLVQESIPPRIVSPQIFRKRFQVLNPLSGLELIKFELGCPKFVYRSSAVVLSEKSLHIPELPTHKRDKKAFKIMHIVLQKYAKPIRFDLRKGPHHVLQLVTEKPIFQLGDVIRLFLDFSKATVRSYQCSARLSLAEDIDANVCTNSSNKNNRTSSELVAEFHQILSNVLYTNLEFYIPTNYPPTFATELISVYWILKLEFVVSEEPIAEQETDPKLDVAPEALKTLNWQLPILVLMNKLLVN